MNRKTLFELALPPKSIVSDNSCYINEQKKKQICDALKTANFSQHIIAFINEFAGISVMVSIDKHLFQSFDVILPRIATVNTCELLEMRDHSLNVFSYCLDTFMPRLLSIRAWTQQLCQGR